MLTIILVIIYKTWIPISFSIVVASILGARKRSYVKCMYYIFFKVTVKSVNRRLWSTEFFFSYPPKFKWIILATVNAVGQTYFSLPAEIKALNNIQLYPIMHCQPIKCIGFPYIINLLLLFVIIQFSWHIS